MKTIKKIKNNLGKVAGSALLVGATVVAGGAALAQDSGSSGDLSDYPAPFVNEDGEVDTSIVVGETAEDDNPVSTLDVVAGMEIAGSLGNAAFTETEESVSVEGGVASWTAEAGETLNRDNSNLFLTDATDHEETSFDDRDIDILETAEFTSEDGETVEAEFEANVGTQDQAFSAAGDRDDPVLHVENPVDGNLFTATVDFDETMDFTTTDTGDNGKEVLEDGDEIALFGQTYTFSSDSDSDELVLFGDSETFDAETGDEQTVTVDGEEATFETVNVPEDSSSDATVRVNGQLESVSENDDIRVNGQDVRVRNVFRTGSDGEGIIEFAIGSEEIAIQSGGDVEVDGDEVDGVSVTGFGGNLDEVDTMDFQFGAADSDDDYVAAGESFEDPLFGLQFHYGGLSADAAEDAAETVDVEVEEEEDAVFTVTNEDGEEADITFMNDDEGTDALAVDSGETIATYEGEELAEDEYTALNQNEEGAMFQVTDIDTTDLASEDEDGEVAVTIENVFTGESETIEEDGLDLSSTDRDVTLDDEDVFGMDFHVTFSTDNADNDNPRVAFDSAIEDDGQAIYPNIYSETDGAVAFTDTATDFATVTADEDGSGAVTHDIRLPSTKSSGDLDATVEITQDSGDGDITVTGDDVSDVTADETVDSGATVQFTAGEVDYELTTPSGTTYDSSSSNEVDVDLTLDVVDQSDDTSTLGPSAMFLQPEDDEEEEHGYVFTPDIAENAGDMDVDYTGVDYTADLDSEDGVNVGYNLYGSYQEYDTDDSDSETFTLNVPGAQSTSGMAMTGPDGDLSAEGGGSGSVTSMSPTYSFADGVLDSDNDLGQVQNDENLVLVGGPSVNQLVADLAEDGETWTADEYTEGEGLIQHVPNAFADGQDAVIVAGYSGEDTRAAGEFLADYRDNGAELEDSQVTISTETGQVVN